MTKGEAVVKVMSFFNTSVKILDKIWQVGGNGMTGAGDAAVYLVRFGDKAALIDSGCGGGHEQLVENILSCLDEGVEISHLLLTHCHFDHTGGAAALRERFGCGIMCHKLDAEYLEKGDSEVTAASWYGAVMDPLSIDGAFQGKSKTIPVGNGEIRAYHCPGHSPGSVVYTVESEGKKVLFGQDIHGPLHSSLLSDREKYLDSLKFIVELNADILCEGHFGVFRGKSKVRHFIESYMG